MVVAMVVMMMIQPYTFFAIIIDVEAGPGSCTDYDSTLTSRECNNFACPDYSIFRGEWSVCSEDCGGGTQTRDVHCLEGVTGEEAGVQYSSIVPIVVVVYSCFNGEVVMEKL